VAATDAVTPNGRDKINKSNKINKIVNNVLINL
jgi:hypothetical protein